MAIVGLVFPGHKASLLPVDTLRVGRIDLVLVHAPVNQVETTLEVGS